MRRSFLLLSSFILIALANALIYWLAFTQPYHLLGLYKKPLLDLYQITRGDALAPQKLLLAFIALSILYWLGWRVARQLESRLGWIIVLLGAVVSGTILLYLYPFDAADIFDNIMHGRILGVYGANPFVATAREFKSDLFYPYVGWKDSPSAYGPIWETLAGVTTRLAGNGIVVNVLAFKLLNSLFFFTSLGLVVVVLKHVAPQRLLAGATLFAWNPIILYETFGMGHNDIALVTWVLAAVWAMAHRRYSLAVLALTVGALIKFIPILLLPVAILIAIHQFPSLRARLRLLVFMGLATAFLVVTAYAPFWTGQDVLGFARRNILLTSSLPAVAYVVLMPWLGEKTMTVVNLTAGSLTLVFAVWQGWRARRTPDDLSFIRASFNILMFYLLLTCSWFQSWYAIWPLALAALLPPGHLARLGTLFGFAALAKPLVFAPMFLWIRPLPPKAWRELRLGPMVLVIPWLYALFIVWRAQRPKRDIASVEI
jgi:hypothetical protein